MKEQLMRSKFLFVTTALLAMPSAFALESATTGSQATQATVGVINSKVDTGIAALQNRLDKMSACEAQRKFYAPSDPKKDANGCVGIQDYNLTMATGTVISENTGGSGHGLTVEGGSNGLGVVAHSTNQQAIYGTSDSNWAGYFTGAYGVYGQTANAYAVQGNATGNGYGVVGTANGSGYAVYGVGTNSWGGVFRSPQYGVYGEGATYGVYSAGPLCINTSGCITSWRQAGGWGGSFTTYSWYSQSGCVTANAYTGGCSCPAGYSSMGGQVGVDVHTYYYRYDCYR